MMNWSMRTFLTIVDAAVPTYLLSSHLYLQQPIISTQVYKYWNIAHLHVNVQCTCALHACRTTASVQQTCRTHLQVCSIRVVHQHMYDMRNAHLQIHMYGTVTDRISLTPAGLCEKGARCGMRGAQGSTSLVRKVDTDWSTK